MPIKPETPRTMAAWTERSRKAIWRSPSPPLLRRATRQCPICAVFCLRLPLQGSLGGENRLTLPGNRR